MKNRLAFDKYIQDLSEHCYVREVQECNQFSSEPLLDETEEIDSDGEAAPRSYNNYKENEKTSESLTIKRIC